MSRVLVVANETVEAEELLAELRRIEDERSSTFFVVAPAVAAGHGLADTWSQAGAIDAAQERLDRTLAVLQSEGLECSGTPSRARAGSARTSWRRCAATTTSRSYTSSRTCTSSRAPRSKAHLQPRGR